MTPSNKKITRLDWDSNFFGIEVGSIANSNDELKITKNSNFDLIYIHSNEPLKNTSIPLYDKKVTFRKIVSKKTYQKTKLIKKYSGKLTSALLDLTIASGIYSRFKLDPKLYPYFKKLYTLWIENSLNGQLAEHVFVSEKEDQIIGFLTLKKKDIYHQIGLIATSSEHRGMGIGSSLLEKAEETVLSEEGTEIRVVTQLDNITACKFYKKNGYKVHSVEYIYHWLL